jgi:hypothetical protein
MTNPLVSPKTQCDQCLQGTLSLLRQGTYHSTRTGIIITSVPLLYCKTCKQYSYDLHLLTEIEQALPHIQVPFRHLHIDVLS